MSNKLRIFIERIETLEEEKKATADDIAELYKEAKANGFDTVVMRAVVKRRKLSDVERDTADELLATYERNLATQFELPIGERCAPLKREEVRADMSEGSFKSKVRRSIKDAGFEPDPERPNVFHAKTPESVN